MDCTEINPEFILIDQFENILEIDEKEKLSSDMDALFYLDVNNNSTE